MPERISSSDRPGSLDGYAPSSDEPNQSIDADVGGVCLAEGASELSAGSAAEPALYCPAPPTPGTQSLVAAHGRRQASVLVPDPSSNDTNARRRAQHGIEPTASAGTTSLFGVYAGAAALAGRDAKSGLEVEVFTASVQAASELEVQAGLVRVGGNTEDGVVSGMVDAFTARANAGIHNDDGSIGANFGAGATAIGGEVSVDWGDWRFSGGADLGVSVGGHVGLRDADADGNVEVCVGASATILKGGICAEIPNLAHRGATDEE